MTTAVATTPKPAVATALGVIIRASFLVQLALGLFFWTGRATQLIPLHRVTGFVLVIAVWALAFIAARAGVNPRLVAAAVLWGLVAPVLGLTQELILPGSFHWTVQILHVLVGFGLIGLAENLGRRLPAEPAVQVKGR
jgi:CDP-diglyceride synthetase